VAEARAVEQARQVQELQRQAQQRDAELAQARAAASDQARLDGELAERLARGGYESDWLDG
jgi:hypothetical protein